MSTRHKENEITQYYGLNSKTSKGALPLGFSSSISNIDLSIPGVAKTVGGNEEFTDGQMGFDGVRMHDFYRPTDETHYFLVQGSTKVAKISAAGTPSDIFTGLTDSLIMDFINFKNTCYMSNGTDEGKAYDGTTARKWGIDYPSTGCSTAGGGAGALTGAYQYLVSFYNHNTGHESSVNVTPATFTASSQQVDLSSIPVSADSQVTRRRIYRTTSGGSIFYFLHEITDNTTTTYTDNNADSALGSTEGPTDNDPPNSFLFLEEWDGRIWGVQPNSTELEFSNSKFLTPTGTGLPEESFSVDNRIDVNKQIRGIKKSPNFNELWVHTSHGIIKIKPTSDPDDPYVPEILSEDESTIAHHSIVNIFNQQWFMDENAKIKSIDSAGFIRYLSNLIEPHLVGSSDYVGLNFTKLNEVQAVNYRRGTKNQYRIIATESGETFPNVMYAANYFQITPTDDSGERYPVWERHVQSTKAIAVVKNSSNQDVLYTSNDDEHVLKQDTGTNFNGSAIDWEFSIGWARTGERPVATDLIRWIKSFFNPNGDYNISMRLDFDFGTHGGQVYSINMAQAGDQLDVDFILDESLLAGIGLIEKLTDVVGDYRYIEITFFGNALDQTMELHNVILMPNEAEGVRRPSAA